MKGKILFLLLVSSTPLFSQKITRLDTFNLERIKRNETGMYVLGGWGAANIAYGIPTTLLTAESEEKYFHEMNVIWNTVNLGLGISGILSSRKERNKTYGLYDSFNEQSKTEKIYLFNAGLDVGYVMTGFFLKEWGKNNATYKNTLTGYGNSLLLQGGFLLGFDLVMFAIHNSHGLAMKPFFSHLRPASDGIGFAYHF